MPGLPLDINPEEPAHSLYEGIEYKEFWNGSQKRNLDELEQSIVYKLLPNSGRRIIDVGCGYGRLADCYLRRFHQVIMVDGSISLLRQAIERTRGQAVYIACDVTNLPFRTAAFDTVLMIRVFHHLTDSQACLSELHRLLCKEGRFVFSYCNKRNAMRVIRWLIRTNLENPFTLSPSGVGSTLISHHPKAIHRMLYKTGFSSMRYYGVGVLDRLSGSFGLRERWINLAERLAPILASSMLAPWILSQAISTGGTSYLNANGIGDIIICPSCGGNLSTDLNKYICVICNKHYPIEGGIIDLRVQ